MKVFEYICLLEPQLKRMQQYDITYHSLEELAIYRRFMKFAKHGDSKEEIISFMADMYNISQSEMSDIINKMEETII